jgi:hypothetical protein
VQWIWLALALQLIGYVVDVLWHALLGPAAEPTTRSEMVRHLATVHLPLYIGAVTVLVSTLVELVRRRARAPLGMALPIAVAGAALSLGAEAWHAVSHLRLDTHAAPIAGILSGAGFLVVAIAMVIDVRRAARKRAEAARQRRAA